MTDSAASAPSKLLDTALKGAGQSRTLSFYATLKCRHGDCDARRSIATSLSAHHTHAKQ